MLAAYQARHPHLLRLLLGNGGNEKGRFDAHLLAAIRGSKYGDVQLLLPAASPQLLDTCVDGDGRMNALDLCVVDGNEDFVRLLLVA